MSDRISSSYLHALQAKYMDISSRGLCMDAARLQEARIKVNEEIQKNLKIASDQWNCHVYVGRENDNGTDDSVNINSTQGERALLKKLQNLGYDVPKITKKDKNSGEYESKYSTGELALQKMLIANQFNYVGGDPALRAILKVRELGKLRSSYLNCRLYKSPEQNLLYFSGYNVAGTLTGRRSSKRNTFGFGNNGQNFPEHGEYSGLFGRCIISRPGNVFLKVDQKSAEEWPVNALANNQTALGELRAGVNRHTNRAIYLFNPTQAELSNKNWKKSIHYYLGKKVGHASNYGMKGMRMSDSIVQESGYVIPPKMCQVLLDKHNAREPNIQGVFHKYVRDKIYKDRVLPTPFGRERQFLGVRPNDNNYSVFNEAFAYIPQSVVGDNTGFAVYYLESVLPYAERAIVQEGHDSIVQDVPNDCDRIWWYLNHTERGFDREIRFHNGITVKIPIEAEIGYDFVNTVKIKSNTYDGVLAAFAELSRKREAELDGQGSKEELATGIL